MVKEKEELRVAVVQMTSSEIVSKNLDFILNTLEKIEQEPEAVNLICFPENSVFMRVNDKTKIQIVDLQDSFFDKISEVAKRMECFIHLGSFAVEKKDKLYNSTVWINSDGEREVSYQKMHLFDIAIEGQKVFRESDVFSHGEKPVIKNIFGWKLGESICYDIRFSELYCYYAKNNVDMILIPAAFLELTGKEHWETLIRARAIESQAYVVASCQAGTHTSSSGEGRVTFGHSMIVDPWGQVILKMPLELGYQISVVSKKNITKVRSQIPMVKHRREFFGGKNQ
jgi:predicted amidohydrolase